jgi:hypothetical protein
MIDIHPPQHAAITRRDFFIHLGIVVLGILIAIGLEQTVEYFHHRHQLADLRHSLQHEHDTSAIDADGTLRSLNYRLSIVNTRIAQVEQAIQTRKPLPPPPAEHYTLGLRPVDPIWKAAKASNLIAVMPQEDVEAYSAIDLITDDLNNAVTEARGARRRRLQFEERSRATQNLDLSSPTAAADLTEYLRLLIEERDADVRERELTVFLKGALAAVARGERDLNRIGQASIRAQESAQ